eukprot:CAMPEP_0203950244 /NCGR_PEP_ID=MMETSP0359-20131031/84428_1 /ASSEMBLY_ACC=CAM_ASM_000338 /TAXON_ID=268821 /ORGANISM="Scrippsiella Hangoei, Strain SHTV-5" /LENGTH=331 /DNA_ID=CAMNT_0050882401 /DNA_START=48 /DNA_END=1043 /DNA_ORIENTATION=+
MGREETMASTGFVPARICWITYVLAAASVALCFSAPPCEDPWRVGLLAICVATCVVYVFSFAYSNTSIYDPAWCLLPIFVAVGWMLTAKSSPSPRGWYALGLFVAWFLRYSLWWPWDGWTVGLRTEDWRYIDLAEKIGGVGRLYWLLSLTSLHLTPSLLVFFGLGPLQRLWTSGASGAPPLGALDAVAAAVSMAAMLANGAADTQLWRFRQRAAHPGAAQHLETEHCAKTCRQGLWAYSRHPNYCCEATFWLGIAICALAGDTEGAVPMRWAWGGSVVMFMFFRVSASLMDARSLKHRKGFAKVMQEVPALLPVPMALDRLLDKILVPGYR